MRRRPLSRRWMMRARGPGTGPRDDGSSALPCTPSEAPHRNGSRADRPRAEGPRLTVIVPTRNEADNVQALVARLDAALGATEAEILFVDDSDDSTEAAVARTARGCARVVRVVHRPAGRRLHGLGGAVTEGIRAARGPWVCVMDGDLQHPPELVPVLFERALKGEVDLVAASRFRETARPWGLSAVRRAVSRCLAGLARGLFPHRLHGVTDPLTGFFVVRRAALEVGALRPRGFKILLEILVRTPGLRVAEVPFRFGDRQSGTSKASAREVGVYLAQLCRLRLAGAPGRMVRFGLVGASGIVVNTLLLGLFTEVGGLYFLVSAVIATQGSSLWNFLLTERWVFRERRPAGSALRRFVLFLAMNDLALIVRGPLLVLLISAGVQYLVANILSLGALTALRYAAADRAIWRAGAPRTGRRQQFRYSIHEIVTIASEARLPELARFEVDELAGPPTISLRIGRVAHVQPGVRARLSRSDDHLVYREGRLGFGIDLRMGPPIEIVACPLLKRSPHVLYTNVVEPLLRWSFVQHGYALVHAACIAFDGSALLVTARTDTGKTTTILKTLDNCECAFLSDDLTLVSADGRVRTYPKPLTISSHTVGAVRTPLLRRHERLFLPVQSRLHSRSGRRAGLAIARSALPAATLNAIVQAMIPPPKYHVERLVRGVRVVQAAPLTGLVVIERDGNECLPLSPFEALETLMRNCDDAYGFPPYPLIEGFLHSRNGADLKAVERSIVAAALEGVPATLVRSARREWSSHIPLVAAEAALGARENGRAREPEPMPPEPRITEPSAFE